jgi:hypothetical protein
MNDLVRYEAKPLSAADIRGNVNLIQEVMKAVMIGPSKDYPEGVHYGKIPGTPKPTLYKPGAEVLCATFRIAPSYKTEDLSTDDYIRYRITCIGTHQTTGIVLGEGMGECSSNEEKYKWRKAGAKEWEATPENRRRIKYGFSRDRGDYEIKQVRTEPADLANTILKMAAKRAQVAMTLNVTAASDIFTQDIEDLPEELRHDDDAPPPEVQKPQSKSKSTATPPVSQQEPPPQVSSSPAPAGGASSMTLTEGKLRILRQRMNGKVTDAMIEKKFGAPLAQLADSAFNDIMSFIRGAQA